MKLEDLKPHTYKIVSGGIILFLILYLFCCNGNRTQEATSKVVVKEVIKHVHHTDTVKFVPKPITIYVKVKGPKDTLFIHDTTVYVFENNIEDSLIKGRIDSKVTGFGFLMEEKLTYTPKFPKYITQTDSVKITDSVFITKTKQRAYLYLGLGGYVGLKTYDLIPKIGLKLKNDKFISVGYGVKNETINIDFFAPIKLRKN